MYGVFATSRPKGFYWSPSEGTGSGSTSEEDDKTDPGTSEDPSQSSEDGTDNPSDVKKFSQADLDRILQQRLAQQTQSFEKKRKEAEDEAARVAKEKAGEWETLYQESQAKLTEAQSQLAQLEKLTEFVATHVDTTIKDWPQEVRDLDPGNDSILNRLEWLGRSSALAQRLKASTPPSGEHQTPKGIQGPSNAADQFIKSRYTRPDSKP